MNDHIKNIGISASALSSNMLIDALISFTNNYE